MRTELFLALIQQWTSVFTAPLLVYFAADKFTCMAQAQNNKTIWLVEEGEDLAPYAFWVAIGLQALYLVGAYYKVPHLHSTPVFYAQVFAPAFAMVMARTWQSGTFYSLLSSFVIPLGSCLLLSLGTCLAFLLNPSRTHLFTKLGINVKSMLAEWITISSVIWPAVAVAAIIRLIGILISPDD